MTREQFFQEFEKHLEVAEPMRDDIIQELRTHADEIDAGSDFFVQIGDPKKLAHSYNRVHIGFFHSKARMYGAPVVLFFLLNILGILKPQVEQWGWTSNLAGAAYYLIRFIEIAGPLTLIILLARTFTRRKSSGREFVLFIAESVTLTIIEASITSAVLWVGLKPFFRFTADVFLYAFYAGFLSTVIYSFITVAAMVLTKPLYKNSSKIIGARLFLEMLLYVIISTLVLPFSIILLEAMFAPYDIALSRPPAGSVLSLVNDSFENGIAALVIVALLEAALLFFLVRRLKTYHALKSQQLGAWIATCIGGIGISAASFFVSDNIVYMYISVFLMTATMGAWKPIQVWRWGFSAITSMVLAFLVFTFYFSHNGDISGLDRGVVAQYIWIIPAFAGAYTGKAFSTWWQQRKLSATH